MDDFGKESICILAESFAEVLSCGFEGNEPKLADGGKRLIS